MMRPLIYFYLCIITHNHPKERVKGIVVKSVGLSVCPCTLTQKIHIGPGSYFNARWGDGGSKDDSILLKDALDPDLDQESKIIF